MNYEKKFYEKGEEKFSDRKIPTLDIVCRLLLEKKKKKKNVIKIQYIFLRPAYLPYPFQPSNLIN